MPARAKPQSDGTAPPPHHPTDARADDTTISFGSFRLDCARRLLSKKGEPVRVGARALDLLIGLVNRAGEVVSQQDLVALAWRGVVVNEAGVRVHIAALRRALGDGRDGARYIINISGRGYSFVAPIARKGHAQSVSPASHPPRPTGRVPRLPRLLVGRDDLVNSLSELLLERRFISIIGSGGIGKTTTAVAIADKLRAEFGDDDIAFVDFGAISEPDLVAGAVISAVGCMPAGANPIGELLDFLSDKRALIVFDSCEHLLDPTSLLAARIFHHAPGIHLLVTSREPLRVEGETIHLLSPLTYPADERPTAAQALATSAVQLFMDRAEYSGFDGELSDIQAPIVSGICRRMNGIALAIELAASRVGTHGIGGVANLIASNVELGLVGRRNAAPRHRTLESMLDWSFRLLTREEQRVLSCLSVLIGPFTMEAACSVADRDGAVSAGTIVGLVDKSLVWVQHEGDAVFYRLPDTTRTYAAAKLGESKGAESIARRHALYFAGLFKAIALEPGAYADLGRHAPHLGNVRKALEWCFSSEECRVIGVELAADAAPLFLGLWLLVECRYWSRLALSTIETIDNDIPRGEARLQEALAVSEMHTLGSTPDVRGAIERGLDLSEVDGQGLPQLRLLAGLNTFLTRLGDFKGGLVAAKRCEVVAERGGSLSDRVIAEWMLAAAHHLAGDQAAAVAHYERGSKLEAAIGRLEINLFGYDHHLRAKIALARSVWLLGAPRRACGLALEAMDEAMRMSPPSNYGMAAAHCIPVLLWSGKIEESGEHIERHLAHADKHHLRNCAATAWALKGEWLIVTEEPSAGVEVLREALKRLYRQQLHMVIPAASRALADGLSRCGRHGEASTTIETAISSAREAGQAFYLPELLRTHGEIVLKSPCPDPDVAELAFRRSIELAGEQAAGGWKLKAAIPLATLLIGQSRIDEALALIRPIYEAHSAKSGTADLIAAANILALAQDPR